MILEQIKGPEELKQLSSRELAILAEEIRTFLIEKISRTGGHLASNLGVVELTIALFKTFDLPQDKIIWDVGHQSYTHKILSGRMAEFDELRQYGGISGFPKRKESPYDPLTRATAPPLFLPPWYCPGPGSVGRGLPGGVRDRRRRAHRRHGLRGFK